AEKSLALSDSLKPSLKHFPNLKFSKVLAVIGIVGEGPRAPCSLFPVGLFEQLFQCPSTSSFVPLWWEQVEQVTAQFAHLPPLLKIHDVILLSVPADKERFHCVEP